MYIGHFSVVTQKKIRHFIKRYCNDLDIKLVFSSFKIGYLLDVEKTLSLAGFVHVWFISLHFSTRVREHLVSDRNVHVRAMIGFGFTSDWFEKISRELWTNHWLK